MTTSVVFAQMANCHLFSANRNRKFVFLGQQTVIDVCCFSKHAYLCLVVNGSYWDVQLANAKLTGTKNAPEGLILRLRP
jgi:hypothetical protein